MAHYDPFIIDADNVRWIANNLVHAQFLYLSLTPSYANFNKVDAIRILRSATGLGLKDAKDAIEDAMSAIVEADSKVRQDCALGALALIKRAAKGDFIQHEAQTLQEYIDSQLFWPSAT
jgi:hypothetical protein